MEPGLTLQGRGLGATASHCSTGDQEPGPAAIGRQGRKK